MKNFLIVLLIILIIGGTGYAIYYQVDAFNKKQESANSSEVNQTPNQVSIDINSNEAKSILNLLDITNNQENIGLQSIFINLDGEIILSNLTNDNKQNIIYYTALKRGILKDTTNTSTLCANGCKSILKEEAKKIGLEYGIDDLDSIYNNNSKVGDTYLYATKKEVADSTINHNVSILEVGNTTTLTDNISIQYKDTSKQPKNKTIKYDLGKTSNNQYTLNKILIES